MGYVYLFLEIDDDGNERHKIGITKNNPELRVKQLQTGNPSKISLLQKYESDNYLKVEQWMHRKHGACKTEAENEWRKLPNEDVISFLDDCKSADEKIIFLKQTNPFYK